MNRKTTELSFTILGALLTLMCSLPPLQRQEGTVIETPTHLELERSLLLEKEHNLAQLDQITQVKWKLDEQIDKTWLWERKVVCSLLHRRERLREGFTSLEHARDRIAEMKREIANLSTEAKMASGMDKIDLEELQKQKEKSLLEWEKGEKEMSEIEEGLQTFGISDYEGTSLADYCYLRA